MSAAFRVGLTRDLLTGRGEPSFGDAPLAVLRDAADLTWEFLKQDVTEITPDLAAEYDALYVNSPLVTAASVGRDDLRLRIVARHGVGYDSVDMAALTRAGVVLTNTPEAVRRPVATMAITYVLALAQKLLIKDRLTRAGGWNRRTDHMGQGLTGKTLGLVGAGGIGREIMTLIRPFGMRVLAADPYADAASIHALDAELVKLDTVLEESDFVVIVCLLNEETRHLIGAAQLRRMKPTSYLINVARGPIVDEPALISALEAGTIAGAGLDVFEREPVEPDNKLLRMENVIVSPHALCWTDENFGNIARSGLSGIAAMAARRTPRFIVNPDVLNHQRVRDWLRPG